MRGTAATSMRRRPALPILWAACAALGMVVSDNDGIIGNAVQCGRDRLLRNAQRTRFLFETVEPVGKIAALAIRGERRVKPQGA